jgi:DNA-nicking Smr family endonuclease
MSEGADLRAADRAGYFFDVAKRVKKKRSSASPEPEPFNNPLRSHLKTLRKEMRRSVRAAEADGKQPKPVQETERTVVLRDDADEFREAAQGSAPLASKRGRVRNVAHARGVRSRVEDEVIDFTADEHFDVRFSDRYIRASAAGVSKETVAKLERGEFAVRSHVDLHGMALDDARRAVDEFLADRHRYGERCVLVITGKGRNSRRQVGILREKIPEWLARGPSARRVLAFVTARPCDGGEGALYVLLRKDAASKTRIDVLAGSGS